MMKGIVNTPCPPPQVRTQANLKPTHSQQIDMCFTNTLISTLEAKKLWTVDIEAPRLDAQNLARFGTASIWRSKSK